MKLIFLSLQIFTSFVKRKTLLFFIVVCGFTISMFGILFYTSYFTKSYYDFYSLNNTKVTINLNKDCNKQQLLDLKESFKVIFTDNETKRISLYEKPPEQLNNESFSSIQQIPVIGELLVSQDNNIVSGRYFNTDEKDQNIIGTFNAMSILKNNQPIGSTINIKNASFKIIGVIPITDIATCFIVPFDKYIEFSPSNYMVVEFSNTFSVQHKQKMTDFLNSNPAISTYEIPKEENPFESPYFLSMFAQAVLIFIVAMANVFTLVVYWIKSNARTLDIYFLLGCNELKLTTILTLANVYITLLSTVVGVLIFAFIQPLIYTYGIIELLKMNVFIMAVIIMIAIDIFLSLIVSLKYRNKVSAYKIQGE